MAPVIRGLPNTTDTTKMIRLDQLLVSQGLASSRTRAQRLIKNGRVFLSDGTLLSKPSEKWPTNAPQQHANCGGITITAKFIYLHDVMS